MANSIFDYFNDDELWRRNIRPLEDPKIRLGTPTSLKSPFGKISLETRFSFPSKQNWKGGGVYRFNYYSIEEDGSEHDNHPFVILLDRPDAGGVIRYSETKGKEGLRYFTGLNLNYLESEAVSLMIDAVVLQNATKGPVTYEALMSIDSRIPYHVFRMYYLKNTSNTKEVMIKRA